MNWSSQTEWTAPGRRIGRLKTEGLSHFTGAVMELIIRPNGSGYVIAHGHDRHVRLDAARRCSSGFLHTKNPRWKGTAREPILT